MHVDAERGAQGAHPTQQVDLAPDTGVRLQCNDSIDIRLPFEHLRDAPVHHDMNVCIGHRLAQQRECRSR